MTLPIPHAARRRANAKLSAAVALALIGAAGAGRASADDLSTITSRVQSQLLSKAPSTATVQGYMNSEQTNGSWLDVNYADTSQTNWSPGTHLSRMASMAEIWANPASSLYHSATLATDLRDAMDYWFSFTSDESESNGNPTPYSSNWFDNDISGPQSLGSAMIMAQSDSASPVFTSSELTEAQRYLLNAKENLPSQTGQNTVDESIVGVYSSIVSGSTSDMTSAFNSMNGTVFVSNFGTDGIQADHTYQYHGIQLYMGGYGSSYINDMLNWASLSTGTSYALTTTQLHTLVDYLLDGTQWFIRGQTLDLTADGRQVTFPGFVGAGTQYFGAIKDALTLGNYRTSELQAFLARQQATVDSGAASSTQNILSGNRQFYDSDIMVQQRAGYYASVKADSSRTQNPETGNDQGLKNLYLGDGVNQIMVTGNEYLGIQPVWNWYRLPGTTIEQDGRSLANGNFATVKGTTAFAGGVSDGTYGAEALNYSRFDVNAKKGWFFFDNEEVALGAAITSTSTQYEVDTTLNQCLLTSSVSYETTGNSPQTFTTGTVTPANLKWVYQGGVGYFFLTPVSNATIEAVSQSGTWYSINTAASTSTVTDNVFTLYIDHGTAVSNGSYSYIAVPGIAENQMDAYLASNPITVLSNTSTLQAVHQSTLNFTQALFYSAGSVTLGAGQTVASSAPSAILLQNPANSLKLSASSPQASTGPLSITLTNVNLSGGSTWFDSMGTATVGFNLPGGNIAASTVGITLTSDAQPNPTVSLTSNDQITNSTYTVTAPVALTGNTTFQEDSFASLAFTAPISGSSSLTQAGPGLLTLSGANTYTGGTNITGGTVLIAGTTADTATTTKFGGSGTVTIAAGAALNLGTTQSANSINFGSRLFVLSGAGVNNSGVIYNPGNQQESLLENFALAGNTTINTAGRIDFFRKGTPGATGNLNGFTLTKTGTGQFTFTGTGQSTIISGGALLIAQGRFSIEEAVNIPATGGTTIQYLDGTSAGFYSATGSISAPITIGSASNGTAPAGVMMGNESSNGTSTVASPITLEDNLTITPLGGTGTSQLILNGNISETGASHSLTLASSASATATLNLGGTNTYTGGTTVTSGTLVATSNGALPANQPLSIGSSGQVQLSPAIGGVTLSNLTIAPGGAMDLSNNHLFINYGSNPDPASTIRTYLTTGYNGGAWNGKGLLSSAASTTQTTSSKYALGYADSADPGNPAGLPAGEIEVMYTLVGDLNLDGAVSGADFATLAGNFNSLSTPRWDAGDVTYDGAISGSDFAALASNFGKLDSGASIQLTASDWAAFDSFMEHQSPVPEPATLSLLALSAAALTRRKRPT